MNKQEARNVHRKCLAALTDIDVRNLMEHAANETPILDREHVSGWFHADGMG